MNNTVGGGVLGRSPAEARGRRWNQHWETWAKDPERCDYDARLDFYGIQALAFRCVVEAGEVLIRKRIDPSTEFPSSSRCSSRTSSMTPGTIG